MIRATNNRPGFARLAPEQDRSVLLSWLKKRTLYGGGGAWNHGCDGGGGGCLTDLSRIERAVHGATGLSRMRIGELVAVYQLTFY